MKRNLLETILRTVFLLLIAAFLYYLFYKPVEGFFVKEDACSVARADKSTIDTEISKFLTGDKAAWSGGSASSDLINQCKADPNYYWCKDVWVGYNNMIPSTLSAAIGTRSEIQDALTRNNCTTSSTQFLCQTLTTQLSLLNDAITSSQSDINEYTQYISEKKTNSTNLDTLIQNAC